MNSSNKKIKYSPEYSNAFVENGKLRGKLKNLGNKIGNGN